MQPPVHISIVLDRSGSMSSIADDIVGGFNEFLAAQRRADGMARVTLAQFDSENPFEVAVDGADLARVRPLRRGDYQPRGATPLYDAIGRMIGRIDAEVSRRADLGLVSEDQLVVIITDGLENASSEHTRAGVMRLIEERRERGWAFAFLGANQDAYAEGRAIGVAAGSAAPWQPTPAGAREALAAVAAATTSYRSQGRAGRRSVADRLFGDRS